MRILILRLAITLPCIILALIVAPAFSLAVPFDVEVLQRTYTTFVSAYASGGTPSPETRTQSSSTPIGDFMYIQSVNPPIVPGYAAAEAKAFEVTASGFTDFESLSTLASAKTEMTFTPLVDGTANLQLDIHRTGDYEWTGGAISLIDRTANQQLWNYGWTQFGNPAFQTVNNVPHDPNDATFALNTYFAKDHTYSLSLYDEMSSNGDIEFANIKVSGLQVVSVPEPSSLLLFGIALVTLGVWRIAPAVSRRLTTPGAF